MASVRYIVNSVDDSIKFYCDHLGFSLKEQYGPAMAIVAKGDLTLWLAGPPSSAAQPMPDGAKPVAGGWNRFVFQVKNLSDLVQKMQTAHVKFRNQIISGPGGSQIICEDPSGNPIELFQAN